MTLHRELFNDLPPVDVLLKMYDNAFITAHDADGYYILVQYIAEKYGDHAYELAEEVFQECGLNFDPAFLHTPDVVRRVGYNSDGINIYNIQVRPYAPEMLHDLVNLYNREIRKISRQALLTETALGNLITDGFLVACNEGGQPMGFIHCWVDTQNHHGSVDAFIFSVGRIYEPVANQLVQKANEYFDANGLAHIKVLTGQIPYPFYQIPLNNLRIAFKQKLGHIYDKLMLISRE